MTTRWLSSVGDRVCVEGEIVHVFVDPATLAPLTVPDATRAGLAPYLAASRQSEPAGGLGFK